MQITPEMLNAMYDGACTRFADREKLERVLPLILAQVNAENERLLKLVDKEVNNVIALRRELAACKQERGLTR